MLPSLRNRLTRITRNVLLQSRSLSSSSNGSRVKLAKGPEDPKALLRELCGLIRLQGPITVARYMQEVLTNPKSGFYTSKGGDVLGAKGDFVTSPEISQMFGECIAIWILMEWQKMGQPRPLQLVELGPGRGTLMNDILRTMMKVSPEDLKHINVHLVEVSETMRRVQEAQLCGYFHSSAESSPKDIGNWLHAASSKFGPDVKWYGDVASVPEGFSFFIAQEFFDALPVHKFIRGEKHWHEILIDIDDSTGEDKLRFVRSRERSLNDLFISSMETRDSLEISAKSGVIMKALCERITSYGGSLLVVDYGHSGDKTDTLRAFKKHQQCDPLDLPGTADITADVDFNYLKNACLDTTLPYGPVSQGVFLKKLGIEVRRDMLLKSCTDEEVKRQVCDSFEMLTSPDQMGDRFKVMSVFPKTMQPIHDKYPPVGFEK